MVYSGRIYTRLQLLKCRKNIGCACDYSKIEVSRLIKAI